MVSCIFVSLNRIFTVPFLSFCIFSPFFMHFLLFIFSLFFSVPSPGFFPDFLLRFFSFFCFMIWCWRQQRNLFYFWPGRILAGNCACIENNQKKPSLTAMTFFFPANISHNIPHGLYWPSPAHPSAVPRSSDHFLCRLPHDPVSSRYLPAADHWRLFRLQESNHLFSGSTFLPVCNNTEPVLNNPVRHMELFHPIHTEHQSVNTLHLQSHFRYLDCM